MGFYVKVVDKYVGLTVFFSGKSCDCLLLVLGGEGFGEEIGVYFFGIGG